MFGIVIDHRMLVIPGINTQAFLRCDHQANFGQRRSKLITGLYISLHNSFEIEFTLIGKILKDF
jgi:hypothetical protein